MRRQQQAATTTAAVAATPAMIPSSAGATAPPPPPTPAASTIAFAVASSSVLPPLPVQPVRSSLQDDSAAAAAAAAVHFTHSTGIASIKQHTPIISLQEDSAATGLVSRSSYDPSPSRNLGGAALSMASDSGSTEETSSVVWHVSQDADAETDADASAAVVAAPLSVPTLSPPVITLKPALREVFPSDMRNFYVISLVYLLFTITDTALRVSILLHVNNLGFSAFEISLMFCSYELCGVFTNFAGGLLATQIGLKYMLLGGVACQICSVCLLVPFRNSAVFDVFPTLAGRIAYIAFTQCFSGIAKDMIKLSGKSVSKLVLKKEEQSTLFRLVTNITGAKNAVKGAGFFIGTVLLQFTGFQPTLLILLGLLVILVPFICLQLGTAIGRSGSRIQWRNVLSKTREFNLLCMARLFLFGSRDIWFEVVLPIYFRNQLHWQSIAVGSFLAGWIIVYGGVQSNTDRLALKPLGCRPPTTRHLWPWACALVMTSAVVALAFTLTLSGQSIATATAIVVAGLTAYAVVFAVNSSVHSYLVVLLSDHDKVAQDVGFYYMSNALGRLVGILLGGVLYSFYAMASESKTEDHARSESFAACLWGSCVLITLSAVFALGITSAGATSSTSRAPQ